MIGIVNNFSVIESIYGKLIVNRHCAYRADALIKTWYPHIQEELAEILLVVNSLPSNSTAVGAGAGIGLVSPSNAWPCPGSV